MATRTNSESGQPKSETPDAAYAVAAGLYGAALLAPPAILALSGLTANAGVLYLGFLGIVACSATVTGWSVFRTPGLAVSVGRRSVSRLLPVVPVAWVVVVLGVAAAIGDPAGGAVFLTALTTLGGLFLGLILVTMSRTRYATAVLTDADDLARWEACWPERWRRVTLVGAVVASVLGIGGLAWRFVVGPKWHWAGYLHLLAFLWTPFAGMANPRTFRVTDVGFVVERPLQRRVVPWESIAGYALTREALIVRHTVSWQPAFRCDRADVEDVDAAVAALDSVLESDTAVSLGSGDRR